MKNSPTVLAFAVMALAVGAMYTTSRVQVLERQLKEIRQYVYQLEQELGRYKHGNR